MFDSLQSEIYLIYMVFNIWQSVFFDGWLLLHYVKSHCYGSHELLNARLIASILDKYSKLSRFDSVTIHTEIINLTL